MDDQPIPGDNPELNDRYIRVDHLKDRLNERTARGGIVTLVSQSVLFVLNIVTTAVLARLLTLDDHGLILMVMPIIGFIYLFKDLGLSQATIQKDDVSHGQITMLFWVNCTFSIALMIVTILSAPLVARFFGRPQLTAVTAVLSAGFFLGGLSVQHQALLRRQMRFHMLAVIDITAAAAGLAAGVIAALMDYGYWSLVIKMLATSLVTEGGVWIACGWRPGLPKFGTGAFPMIRFGAGITGFNILNYGSSYIANVLLGKTGGSEEVALYGRARQILLLPIHQINAPLSSVAISSLSRLANDTDAYRRMYVRIIEKIAMVTMPGIAALIAASDWVVFIVLGAQWEAAATIFAYLGIAALFLPVINTAGWLFISQGRSKDMLRWGVIDSVLTIMSITAGLPWGVNGVAAGYAIVTAVVKMPVLFHIAGRTGPVGSRVFYRLIGIPFAASALILGAMIAIRLSFSPGALLGIAISGALATVISLVIYAALPSSRKALGDFRYILALVRSKPSAD